MMINVAKQDQTFRRAKGHVKKQKNWKNNSGALRAGRLSPSLENQSPKSICKTRRKKSYPKAVKTKCSKAQRWRRMIGATQEVKGARKDAFTERNALSLSSVYLFPWVRVNLKLGAASGSRKNGWAPKIVRGANGAPTMRPTTLAAIIEVNTCTHRGWRYYRRPPYF